MRPVTVPLSRRRKLRDMSMSVPSFRPRRTYPCACLRAGIGNSAHLLFDYEIPRPAQAFSDAHFGPPIGVPGRCRALPGTPIWTCNRRTADGRAGGGSEQPSRRQCGRRADRRPRSRLLARGRRVQVPGADRARERTWVPIVRTNDGSRTRGRTHATRVARHSGSGGLGQVARSARGRTCSRIRLLRR